MIAIVDLFDNTISLHEEDGEEDKLMGIVRAKEILINGPRETAVQFEDAPTLKQWRRIMGMDEEQD